MWCSDSCGEPLTRRSWGAPNFLLSARDAFKLQMHSFCTRVTNAQEDTRNLIFLADGTNSWPSLQISLECLGRLGHYTSKMLKRGSFHIYLCSIHIKFKLCFKMTEWKYVSTSAPFADHQFPSSWAIPSVSSFFYVFWIKSRHGSALLI